MDYQIRFDPQLTTEQGVVMEDAYLKLLEYDGKIEYHLLYRRCNSKNLIGRISINVEER